MKYVITIRKENSTENLESKNNTADREKNDNV